MFVSRLFGSVYRFGIRDIATMVRPLAALAGRCSVTATLVESWLPWWTTSSGNLTESNPPPLGAPPSGEPPDGTSSSSIGGMVERVELQGTLRVDQLLRAFHSRQAWFTRNRWWFRTGLCGQVWCAVLRPVLADSWLVCHTPCDCFGTVPPDLGTMPSLWRQLLSPRPTSCWRSRGSLRHLPLLHCPRPTPR